MTGPKQSILTIGELTKLVKRLLEDDPRLSRVWVRGEISNFKHHTSGHLYFTLKDAQSCLRCVMFKGAAAGLLFRPENGMQVIVFGSISVYERDGQYQLYVQELQPDGVGALWIAYEQLKAKLGAEGLFDEGRKRRLPPFPGRIALATSPTGAVLRDMLSVLRRRMPGLQIVLAPIPVQGYGAAPKIAGAIQALGRLAEHGAAPVEVIILARGGGSIEELWPFNEEIVARAIAASPVPVLSAIGHETDYTIADFAADHRAATPSVAAETVVPDHRELADRLQTRVKRLRLGAAARVRKERERLNRLAVSRVLTQPSGALREWAQRLDFTSRRLEFLAARKAERSRAILDKVSGKLGALGPETILRRGYAFCLSLPDRSPISGVQAVGPGELLGVILQDGEMECKVTGVTPRDRTGGAAGGRGRPA
ncbi:MAG: exodeoxyribonuclease VII large subunit [Firmicutes bacterium]|nr:exodeoxyribonuclease VII large subunit [Bacillota bacterium]